MQLTGDWTWHVAPVLLMLGMLGLNHLIIHRKTERRLTLEAQRLRAALAAELRVLDRLYQDNLKLIEQKAGYVLSTRSPLCVYKHSLGKLTSLFEAPVIEYLVTLYAQNELIEAHLAANANPKGGTCYRLTHKSEVEQLQQMYTAAAQELVSARQALGAKAEGAHLDGDLAPSRGSQWRVPAAQTHPEPRPEWSGSPSLAGRQHPNNSPLRSPLLSQLFGEQG